MPLVNGRILCFWLVCVLTVVAGVPHQSGADCRRVAQSTSLKETDQAGYRIISKSTPSLVSLCYTITSASSTNITLNDEFSHCDYMIEPYSKERCDDASNKDYSYPLNQDYPTLTLNERNVICSYRLGRKPAPGTKTSITFEYDGDRSVQVNQHESSDKRQCFPVGTKDYPCGIVRKVGVIGRSNDFVKLYAGDECEEDTVLQKMNGSAEFSNEEDLAAVVQLSPDEEVKSFKMVLYYKGEEQ